jgi:protein phosphatase
LENILNTNKNFKGAKVFLGDYGDRGDSPRVYERVLELAIENPEDTILLRGNHEDRELVSVGEDYIYAEFYPFTLRNDFERVYGKEDGLEIAKALIQKVWPRLYLVACSHNYLFVHGGVPTGKKEKGGIPLDTIKKFKKLDRRIEVELLWNDPWEEEENILLSRRGLGYFFGKKASEEFLEGTQIKMIIRGHEPNKSGIYMQDGKILTIASCPNIYEIYGHWVIIEKEKHYIYEIR